MNPHSNRARLGGVLLAAAAALAMLALPGLAASHSRNHDPAADAGTIQSFDPETGVLTIDLANGGSVSGLVTARTHIRCGDDRGRHRGRHGLRQQRHGKRRHPASASHAGGREGNGRGNGHSNDDPPGHDGTAPGRSEHPGKGAEHSGRCRADDLVAGAPVRLAVLILIDGNALYKHIALHKPTS